ncbi:MAG: aspartate carbamoyltransferase [Desulfobacterales bacterium]|nr:MAG: aspartate carbamoyltransferase [Desulfobacterales bacterium]UCD89117.1 MAG: aspartate carbamoyltransferase [Desulfobacterales bacterium]
MMHSEKEETIQIYPGWTEFYNIEVSDKLDAFIKRNRLFDIIFAQQFDRPFLDFMCELANQVRLLAKTKLGARVLSRLLSHKRAMLYFVQPSTRTFISFMNACHILGMKASEIRGTTTSSEVKGESAEDTIRTFSSYVDLIVVRHPEAGFAEKTAWVLNQTERPVSVINGGSGPDQHPTQALLDIYTLERSFEHIGGLDGKKIAMVGDLKRGRTVRSLSYLMKNYKDVTLYFVSPEIFKMKDDIKNFLKKHDIQFYETDDFASVMPIVDAIYMTRIQKEYATTPAKETDIYPTFHFRKKDLANVQSHCIIMHPLPRRYEIEVDVDKDPRAVYWRQERNGMWIRAALIAYLFGVDDEIACEFN